MMALAQVQESSKEQIHTAYSAFLVETVLKLWLISTKRAQKYLWEQEYLFRFMKAFVIG